jgi:hypothetical protein
MSKARVCDKCGCVLPAETVDDYNTTKAPDLLVSMGGATIVDYQDLCELCTDRCKKNSKKYLTGPTRAYNKKDESE